VTFHKAVYFSQDAPRHQGRRFPGSRAKLRLGRAPLRWLVVCSAFVQAGGCIVGSPPHRTVVMDYQQQLVSMSPQPRVNMDGTEPNNPVGLLEPAAGPGAPLARLPVRTDPNSGQQIVSLTLEEAITRTLANSPEIQVVSFDPQIAKQEIIKATAEFDPTAFARADYEEQDDPKNSYFEPGRADRRLVESGIRQRTFLGSEWSASYALSRTWDDMFGRAIPTRYEPMLVFQLRQPLLRDAGPGVNLAGVNVAQLQHLITLEAFRERAETVSAGVMVVYWRLVQAQRRVEIQQQLVAESQETLRKVDGRREIDATDVQLMQARAYTRLREADLLEFEQEVSDTQDVLARLIADPQINTASKVKIVPATAPELMSKPPDLALMPDDALAEAMGKNPAVRQAQIGIKIADINVQFAQNQALPRLDLLASTRGQGLARHSGEAHDQLADGDYVSYEVGVTLEMPLGNRAREAELMRRRLERRKALSILHNTADQVAVDVKEKARKARTKLEQIQPLQAATAAAQAQLQALKESEPVRERLTPELLLVELQAQDTYAQAQRDAVDALIEFNVALAELARTTGTVFELHRVENAVTTITEPPAEAQSPEPVQ
jgi:outer membrane protein